MVSRFDRFFINFLVMLFCNCASAQEFNCTVEVNSQSVEGTRKSVFESLQSSLSTYMNDTKFSEAVFETNERIECRLFLTVKEYSGDRIKGDLQIQLSRPVYNSSYSTTLFNFRDSKVEFDYHEGEPLVFNRNSEDSNLIALLNFYAYLMLAIDFDSFSSHGGDPYFELATSVVQRAQSSGEIGWRMFEDNRNRSSLLSAFTDSSTSGLRDILYNYHRKGLDVMSTGVDKGRAEITSALEILNKIYDNAPLSVAIPLFGDSKLDEIPNIYSKASEAERMKVYNILQKIYPTETQRLDKIKNPE